MNTPRNTPTHGAVINPEELAGDIASLTDIERAELAKLPAMALRTERILTDSELATILHALRVLQCAGRTEGCAAGLCEHFEDAVELNDAEIDELCESLNCGELALIEQL